MNQIYIKYAFIEGIMYAKPTDFEVIFVLIKSPACHILCTIISNINMVHKHGSKSNISHIEPFHRMSPITGPMLSTGSTNEDCGDFLALQRCLLLKCINRRVPLTQPPEGH